MSVLIYQHVQSIGMSQARVRRIARTVLRSLSKSDVAVSISFIGEARMRRLNHTYRGLDQPTDVLSFVLGDIFLCPSYIRRQAKRFGVSYQEECTRTLIHGILHLAGYDHATKREAERMFSLQEQLLCDFQK